MLQSVLKRLLNRLFFICLFMEVKVSGRVFRIQEMASCCARANPKAGNTRTCAGLMMTDKQREVMGMGKYRYLQIQENIQQVSHHAYFGLRTSDRREILFLFFISFFLFFYKRIAWRETTAYRYDTLSLKNRALTQQTGSLAINQRSQNS